MPLKALKPCSYPGCRELVRNGSRCEKHQKQQEKEYDARRGSAHSRGYSSRWQRYSRWFLSQPENQLCKIKGPRCKILAECVDHIQAPKGKDDPLFWDANNHQAACIPCNSWKGNRYLKLKDND